MTSGAISKMVLTGNTSARRLDPLRSVSHMTGTSSVSLCKTLSVRARISSTISARKSQEISSRTEA